MIRVRVIGTLVAAGTALATMTIVGAESTAAGPPDRTERPSDQKACGGKRPRKPGGGKYTCSFEDDFTGSKLDKAKWVVQDTALTGVPAGTWGCYVKGANTIAVADGKANLTAYRTPDPFTCKSPHGNFPARYKVATVTTRGKFAQTYGRFAFRAKMPAVERAGVHSALWLYPEDLTYGGWPKSGEIDVAEWWGEHPANVYPSVHYAGEKIPKSTGLNCPVSSASTSYHRYAVDWSPTTMRFFYDGKLCWKHAWTPRAPLSGSQPFDKPFNLVLTQLLYGVEDAAATGAPSTATLKVDWVRVWR